jgi:hypothetical protein
MAAPQSLASRGAEPVPPSRTSRKDSLQLAEFRSANSRKKTEMNRSADVAMVNSHSVKPLRNSRISLELK